MVWASSTLFYYKEAQLWVLYRCMKEQIHLRQQCHNTTVSQHNTVTTQVSQHYSVTTQHCHNTTLSQHNSVTTQHCHMTTVSQHNSITTQHCHNTTLSQHNSVTTQHCHITTVSQHNTVTTQHCRNSKSVIFQEKLLKVLKCYNFLWVQRRHNCSSVASFANCVMTLYLLKVHLQTFLSIPITQKCQILSCDTLVANERYGNKTIRCWCLVIFQILLQGQKTTLPKTKMVHVHFIHSLPGPAWHCTSMYHAQTALITNVYPSDVRNCTCVSKSERVIIYLLWKCKSTKQKK